MTWRTCLLVTNGAVVITFSQSVDRLVVRHAHDEAHASLDAIVVVK